MLELSFLRQYRSRLAFLGGCLILTWIGACATLVSNPSKSERFRRYDARFSRVTPAGKVILQDGTAFKLAGIEMRSVAETEEPTLLRVVNDIIRDSGRRVEIELDSVSGEAVVYYRQRIHYRDLYIRWVRLLWVPEFSRRSVNELLIVMAAARYATLAEDGRMTKKATTACKVAQDKAELALHNKWRHRALSEYMHGGGCQLYSEHDEYKARITKGDVARSLSE